LWAVAQSACAALRLVPIRVVASTPGQLTGAVAQLVSQRAQAVALIADPMYTNERDMIQALLQPTRLPVAYGLRDHVAVGGLLSFGPNLATQWRYAAKFVDAILKGVKPADLPVEQPTQFELVINLKTAKALGITIPQSLLLRADEVIS
jgi:putative ABC transport system substrate-binding protein